MVAVDIKQFLHNKFGFADFLPGQEQAITRLLDGKNAAAIFPTGSGKSICYQLPAMILPGLTIVVSPLIALMKDQIDSLQRRNLPAARLDSTLGEDEYRQTINAIQSGELKALFVSPERVSNERFQQVIRNVRISLLAIDEAHCISAWGHNFRPDYLKLAEAAVELNAERILALTATATPQVCDDIAKTFQIKPSNIIKTGFYRSNLQYRVTPCLDSDRPNLLIKRLRERPSGAAIIYTTLQRQAEEVSELLADNGFNAQAYHAGMKADERKRVQDDFMDGSLDIVCSTIAFGMGIDKPDIRYVYHYHLPKGYESYMQETGRAGRDGEHAVCELFACASDSLTLENFAYGDTPDIFSIRGLVEELLTSGREFDISVTDLSKRYDIRTLVVKTLLTHLELWGVISSTGYFYSDISFAPQMEYSQITDQYQSGKAEFLKHLFSCSPLRKIWATPDIDKIKEQTGFGRDVILRALDDLEAKGLVKLRMKGYRQGFRKLIDDNTHGNLDKLSEDLQRTFLAHEAREIDRIQMMLKYAEKTGCLSRELVGYFAEHIEPCGNCGICLGDKPAIVPVAQITSVNELDLTGFNQVVQASPLALANPRQQARFLCGLNSPAVSADKSLRGHPLFGSVDNTPFMEVLEHCEREYKQMVEHSP